jgi:hypothetical protein
VIIFYFAPFFFAGGAGILLRLQSTGTPLINAAGRKTEKKFSLIRFQKASSYQL